MVQGRGAKKGDGFCWSGNLMVVREEERGNLAAIVEGRVSSVWAFVVGDHIYHWRFGYGWCGVALILLLANA